MTRIYSAPTTTVRGDAVRTTLSVKSFGDEINLTGDPAGGAGFSFGL